MDAIANNPSPECGKELGHAWDSVGKETRREEGEHGRGNRALDCHRKSGSSRIMWVFFFQLENNPERKAFFKQHQGPSAGSFNPTAAAFPKSKRHSLTNENRIWATLSNFFHENHTSFYHRAAQNATTASFQRNENKREKTLLVCWSNPVSAGTCSIYIALVLRTPQFPWVPSWSPSCIASMPRCPFFSCRHPSPHACY